MTSCEQIAFQPALAGMLAEDFHHPTVSSKMVVIGERFTHPGAIGHVKHIKRLEAVSSGPTIRKLLLQVELDYIPQELAHDASCLDHHPRLRHLDCVFRKSGIFRSLSKMPPLA